jgi:hypothetical protein
VECGADARHSVLTGCADTGVLAPMTTTETVQCRCKTCKVNAAALGLPLPLRAEVPTVLLAQTNGKAHGWVHMAHDPNAVTGAAARARTGVRPIGV